MTTCTAVSHKGAMIWPHFCASVISPYLHAVNEPSLVNVCACVVELLCTNIHTHTKTTLLQATLLHRII